MEQKNIVAYLKQQQPYFYNKFGIRFIGIFGSFARDEAHSSSDIDILYEISEGRKLSMFKYLVIAKELEDFFHKKIDLVRMQTLKPQIKNYVEHDIVYV